MKINKLHNPKVIDFILNTPELEELEIKTKDRVFVIMKLNSGNFIIKNKEKCEKNLKNI